MADIILPDFLQDETEEQIMARMIARIPSDLDTSEGSYLWDALAPVAVELIQMKMEAKEILKRTFIQFSFGAYLDIRVAERGLTRNPAVKAVGQVQITGIPNTVISVGTRFFTSTDIITRDIAVEFISIEQTSIGETGTVLVEIEAVEPGVKGNVLAGTINQLLSPIYGVTSVINPEPTNGGAPEESDEDLITRYLTLVRQSPRGGTKNDYIQWAKEVEGVGDAVCLPLWSGPGTVRVIIVDSEGNPANSTLIQNVQDYISPVPGKGEGKSPIGANVTVSAPVEVTINISATLMYKTGYNPADVRLNTEESLTILIKRLKIGEDVLYSSVANAIFDTPGVADYSNLLVNGGTDNIVIAEGAKAILGGVILA